MKSRQDTGRFLASSGVPVIGFRASIVIGAGSLSFEMIRALVQKLPVMTTPKWVYVEAQPIGIGDLLDYLIQALEVHGEGLQVFEVGGTDVVTYADLMQEYAKQRGLTRRIIPLPFLTPRLSSRWLGLVTPLFARVGRKLIDSLKHPTIVRDRSADAVFKVEPRGAAEAIAEALREEEQEFITTRWSDSLSIGNTNRSWGGVSFGTRLVDARSVLVDVPVEKAFTPIRRVGGKTGWYYADFLWRIRGFIDLLVGGVGLRRGRRHPDHIRTGDVIDFWRVECYEPGHLLRLSAEMKVPGRAWLELGVKEEEGKTRIIQTAIFDPVGLGGLLYWYGIYPLHQLVFAGM
ncbi:MAG: SDR family oxidoreductase, partial [Verrucomicrobiota bacterium]